MRGGSLFSGIGGFDLGFQRAGIEATWQVEIDEKCRSVLARHFPNSKTHADVKQVGSKNLTPVDVVFGGFPCQDLSVAGRRAGLDGDRSGLWFEFRRIISEISPAWVVIENVPGLLSSNGGADFAVVVRGLVELGYGIAWRVLDSQYFGVAQRRQRVFIVGHLGDHRATEILFEPESLQRDSPPRREARKDVARPLGSGSTGSSGYRNDADTAENLVARCLNAGRDGYNDGSDQTYIADTLSVGADQTTVFHGPVVSGSVSSKWAKGTGGPAGDECYNLVANPLVVNEPRATSHAGNNPRPRNLVVTPILEAGARTGKSTDDPRAGLGIGEDGDPMFTLQSGKQHAVATGEPFVFDERNVTCPDNRSAARPGDPVPTLHEQPLAVAFSVMEQSNGFSWESLVHPTIQTHPNSETSQRQIGVRIGSAVRRLTPRECERLQGFPDDWTRFDVAGNELADSPRYRMLGNAVTVNVAQWLAHRIAASI